MTTQSEQNKTERSPSRLSPGLGSTEDATIVIFGASGDLTARKLMPALYTLWQEGFLSERAVIVGVARRDKSEDIFRDELGEAVRDHARTPVSNEQWQQFARQLHYHRLDIHDAEQYAGLRQRLATLEATDESDATVGTHRRVRVVYLATAPELFVPAAESLGTAGLIPADNSPSPLRVVFEKPFGHDLPSAQLLSRRLAQLLTEDQIYRIDHYLGKETVQNILLFRFGNAIFEPLFNRHHIDHVQITVAESQGMEGGRGAYYDRAGALRDVMQNHVLQLLCLVAMEPPALFKAREIHDEKLKVLQTLSPGNRGKLAEWAIAGQYAAGEIDGEPVCAYREEQRIATDSRRETFAALDVHIDNWRWAGVPFYLRTGKRMPIRVTELAIQFKLPPLHLFTTVECEGDICDLVEAQPNILVFRIQPDESISLSFSTKRPGMQYQVQPVTMDFAYKSAFEKSLPEAYERLLLDVIRGDSTLFTRTDELEAAWRFLTPVLDTWDAPDFQPDSYPAGSWGPPSTARLLERSPQHWRTPSDSPAETGVTWR